VAFAEFSYLQIYARLSREALQRLRPIEGVTGSIGRLDHLRGLAASTEAEADAHEAAVFALLDHARHCHDGVVAAAHRELAKSISGARLRGRPMQSGKHFVRRARGDQCRAKEIDCAQAALGLANSTSWMARLSAS
jgi:hypothetical protein